MKADYLILTLSTVGINLDLLVLRQISAASWAHVAWEGLYFLPRCMECRRGLAMRILSARLSVCPSLCLSHACIVTKR